MSETATKKSNFGRQLGELYGSTDPAKQEQLFKLLFTAALRWTEVFFGRKFPLDKVTGKKRENVRGIVQDIAQASTNEFLQNQNTQRSNLYRSFYQLVQNRCLQSLPTQKSATGSRRRNQNRDETFDVPIPLEWGSINKAVLRKRGWTRAAIRKFLGEPDRKLGRWDRPKDRPECRYERKRVVAAENSPEFQDWQQGVTKRDKNRKRWWGEPREGWGKSVPTDALAAYNALSRRNQEIILLLFRQGRRQREVAAKLGVSQQTVSWLKRKFECRI